jgi:stage V sporulation protein AD
LKNLHRGKQSVLFDETPAILAHSAVGGKREGEGPLSRYFDYTSRDTKFGQKTWEKAECKLQELALDAARRKTELHNEDLDVLFSGDLLNQCISSSFAVRGTKIPFLGLYGACSTMAESLTLAASAVNAGYARRAAALTSSHFASAERQYRFPLGYGGQRTPTAQWTVTGAGCCLLGQAEKGPFVTASTVGYVVDLGIKDANNMGAAMAPAAYATLRAHFDDLSLSPGDYDLIVTGDLGSLGKEILTDLFRRDGVKLGGVYDDCGAMIFDPQKQDVHAGGSGCGCGASVLGGYLLTQMENGKYHKLLFCATGALMSPTSTWQGESIPAICHAVSIHRERR